MPDDATDVARKRLAEEREVTDRSRQEYTERMKGKPTPTQEENDIAALGGHIMEKEDDGSGPDPYVTRSMEKKPAPASASYETRTVSPRPAPAPKSPQG
jgi:hypothetical protein